MRNDGEWQFFLDLCLKTKKISRLQEFFSLFLTIEETEYLISRMQIIKALLDKKLSQREISEKMQVSISQITRGSNALKIISDDLIKFLELNMRKNKK